MKDKQSPPTVRLDVQIPTDLYDRLAYTSGLPTRQGHGGTFEALVVRPSKMA